MDSQKPTEVNRLTVVEEGTEFRGAVVSSCAVIVKGKVAGELSSPALTVAPSGAVSGKIKVGTLASQGEISGEFDAEHAHLSGRVSDGTMVRARTLDVKLTSENLMTVTFGNDTKLEIGEEPKPGERR
ncbi:MAG: polymer-forming cytoskeletal protein [Polyangiaceae bacterium]|nr:polymer-forming cytoskeletal protein [Polyangiaceae bacterium]